MKVSLIMLTAFLISFSIVGITLFLYHYKPDNHGNVNLELGDNKKSQEINPNLHAPFSNDSSGITTTWESFGNKPEYEYNPLGIALSVSTYADHYLKTKDLKQLHLMEINANWLMVNSKNYGNYSLLEYNFPYYYNMTAPWHSAMAQGEAIQYLTKAYNINHNATYLASITPLLNSFYLDVKDGGVTEKTDDKGWWYEEYADEGGSNPRVLNGMEFTLYGLYYYYNYTGNQKSLYLFNQGLLALKNNISKYDVNGSTYYDTQGKFASGFYDDVHIDMTGKLYEITKEPILKLYHDKWKLYRESHRNMLGDK